MPGWVTSSGLGYISEGPWLKQILPDLNITSMSEDYGNRTNRFTDLTEGSVLDREEFGGLRKKVQPWLLTRDIHVITNELQRSHLCDSMKAKGPVREDLPAS